MASDTPVTEPPYDPLLAKIVDAYINLANMFTEDVSASLVIGIQELFIALAALWVVLTGLMLALAMKRPVDALKEFIFLSIAWLLLSTQGTALVNEVYNTVLAVMGNGASVVFDAAKKGGTGRFTAEGMSGMTALVVHVEKTIIHILGTAQTIAQQATLTNFLPIVYALLLIIPYVIVLVAYFAQVVVAIFRVMFLASISPWLMMAYGFGFFRQQAIRGVSTLLAVFLVLWGSTIAIAVLVYGVTTVADISNDKILNSDAGLSILNAEYFVVVMLGWLGTAFVAEANGITNSLTQGSFTNTAAGIITAGTLATGAAIATRAKGPAGAVMRVAGFDPGKAVARWGLSAADSQAEALGIKAADAATKNIAGFGTVSEHAFNAWQQYQGFGQKYKDFVYPQKGGKS